MYGGGVDGRPGRRAQGRHLLPAVAPRQPRARDHHGRRPRLQAIDPRRQLLSAHSHRLRIEAGRPRRTVDLAGHIKRRDTHAIAADHKPIEATASKEIHAVHLHHAAFGTSGGGRGQLQMRTRASARQRQARRGIGRGASLAGDRHWHSDAHAAIAIRGPAQLSRRRWRIIDQLKPRSRCRVGRMWRVKVALSLAARPPDSEHDGALVLLRVVPSVDCIAEERSKVGRPVLREAQVVRLHLPLDGFVCGGAEAAAAIEGGADDGGDGPAAARVRRELDHY